MAFDAGLVIRVGSAGLFVLLGVAIVALGRGRLGSVALATYLASLGIINILNNLLVTGGPAQVSAKMVAGVVFFAAAVSTMVVMPRQVESGERFALVVGAALAVVSVGVSFGDGVGAFDAIAGLRDVPPLLLAAARTGLTLFRVGIAALPLVVSACVALRPPTDTRGWWRMTALAGVTGLVWTHAMPTVSLQPGSPWAFAATLVFVLGLTMCWLVAAARSGSRFPLAMAFVWPSVALASYLYLALPTNTSANFYDSWGLLGIWRIIGWSLLVYAILRADLLGVPLPHFAVNRGAVAAGSLAVLFIVAQVMQNFFSAEYGLLTGGVIAGAFLFAASPVQRAFESMGEHKSPRGRGKRVQAEDSYRAALRFALKDQKLTKEEERSLVLLAHDLGIAPPRAYELRDEIARERRPT